MSPQPIYKKSMENLSEKANRVVFGANIADRFEKVKQLEMERQCLEDILKKNQYIGYSAPEKIIVRGKEYFKDSYYILDEMEERAFASRIASINSYINKLMTPLVKAFPTFIKVGGKIMKFVGSKLFAAFSFCVDALKANEEMERKQMERLTT